MTEPKRQKRSEDTAGLDPDQRRVIDAVATGRNVFFTGPAGTGKSFVINAVAARGDASIGLTALTGIAALNIGGKTIHSFAGVGLGRGSKEDVWAHVTLSGKDRLRRCRMLIIDEISMMSDDLFEKIDYVARRARNKPDLPFGGIQVVLVGDFFQLPPVSKAEETRYCFESPLWDELRMVHVLLRTNHRQVDKELADGLAKMRMGVLEPEFMRMITEPKSFEGPIKPTRLVGTNAQVDRINASELAKLEGERKEYDAKEEELAKDTLRHLQGESKLVLVEGAQVIHLWNDASRGLVNGSRGVVTGFQDGMPMVLFVGKTAPISVPVHKFDFKERSGKVLCSRQCIPLRLSWAMTIHKSQGQTIDLLEVDCKDMFAASQAYVAVSRARTLAGLHVKNLDATSVWVDPRVEAFYNRSEFSGEETPPPHNT